MCQLLDLVTIINSKPDPIKPRLIHSINKSLINILINEQNGTTLDFLHGLFMKYKILVEIKMCALDKLNKIINEPLWEDLKRMNAFVVVYEEPFIRIAEKTLEDIENEIKKIQINK
jgi:hypothetical protein